jgi:hypothetical protein
VRADGGDCRGEGAGRLDRDREPDAVAAGAEHLADQEPKWARKFSGPVAGATDAPGELATLLDGLPVRWWVAGGRAINLFVGSYSRRHQDLDVAVLRPDQLTVQANLDHWDLRVSHEGRLTRWLLGGGSPARARYLGSAELSLAMAVGAAGRRRFRRPVGVPA